jgi:hypothetical protein
MTLVEIVITMGVASFVALMTSSLLVQVTKSNQRANLQTELSRIRNQYLQILQSNAAWTATIADRTYNTSSFNCLSSSAACLAAGPFAFTPLAANGKPYQNYRPSTPNAGAATAGFSPSGVTCSSYSAATPNGQCPIRVDFTWTPICPPGPLSSCIKPEVEIKMTFKLSLPANTTGFTSMDMSRFSATLRRKGNIASSLSLKYACTSTQVITGFKTTGEPVCVEGSTVR